jgi:hypothetical protein
MPKRMYDTKLWANRNFRRLKPTTKLVYHWMHATCDHAGVIEYDPDRLQFDTGLKDGVKETQELLQGQFIQIIADDVFVIFDFIEEQYKSEYQDANRVHRSVRERLGKFGITWEDVVERTAEAKVQEEQPQLALTDEAQEEKREKQEEENQIIKIREAYPLKNGGSPANKEIKSAIKRHGFEKVFKGTEAYAKERVGQDPKYTKSTLRFFREECYLQYADNSIESIDKESPAYKLSIFLHQGIYNWTGGVSPTDAQLVQGAKGFESLFAQDRMHTPAFFEALIRWIDGGASIGGMPWRSIIKNFSKFHQHYTENSFHDFVKQWRQNNGNNVESEQ